MRGYLSSCRRAATPPPGGAGEPTAAPLPSHAVSAPECTMTVALLQWTLQCYCTRKNLQNRGELCANFIRFEGPFYLVIRYTNYQTRVTRTNCQEKRDQPL